MTVQQRQLIILCDGTNNTLTGGIQDTNVLKLTLHLNRQKDPDQLVWYDPGVGTDAALPGVSLADRIKGNVNRLIGLAQGGGVYENMAEALTTLAQQYRDGDQIFLFGFSRGAFTARAVGGFINEFGLPQAHALHLLPMMINRYFSRGKVLSKVKPITKDTRLVTECRRPFVQFVGVWDTVEAVGLPIPFLYKKITNLTGIEGKCFLNVRHAVSLNEYRSQFKPRLYTVNEKNLYMARNGGDVKPATLVQKGFPGCHSDVGGGYKRAGLSDAALGWIVEEAQKCGLRLSNLPIASPDPQALLHSEIHTNPVWAITGQCVRDVRTVLPYSNASPPEQAPAKMPNNNVWTKYGLPKKSWLVVGALLTALALWCQWRIDPQGQIPGWQLWPFGNLAAGLPLPARDIRLHLLIDTCLLIPAFTVVLAILASAAFARVAERQRGDRQPSRFLNLLGLALPVFLGADLLENLCTWLTVLSTQAHASLLALDYSGYGALHVNGTYLTLICAMLMSIASFFKFAGLSGVVALCVRGIVGK